MANKSDIIIRIGANVDAYKKATELVSKQTKDLEKELEDLSKKSAIAFAGFAATIGVATKAFVDYEKQLTFVGKTTNLNQTQLQNFGRDMQRLSRTIPVATNDLLSFATTAGQLGVAEADLAVFTETIARLSASVDGISGEEAAASLQKVLNITGEGSGNIDRLASTFVQLGNNVAANEGQLLRFAERLAQSTGQFGLTGRQIAGLAGAFGDLGIRAESGASAIGRSLGLIQQQLDAGGRGAQLFSELTGQSIGELSTLLENDAVGALQLFTQALGNAETAGVRGNEFLAEFNITGIETQGVLNTLSNGQEKLAKSIQLANEEWTNNTALVEESQKAFETTDASLKRLQNAATEAAVRLGTQLAPAVGELIEGVTVLINAFNDLDDDTVQLIANFVKWGAIITASLTSVTALAAGFLKMRAVFQGLITAFKVGRIAAIGFTSALTGGLSLILAFLPEILSGISSLVNLMNDEEPETLQQINAELGEMAKLRKEINESPLPVEARRERIAEIDAEVQKLEELRRKKLEADVGNEDGSLLFRPQDDVGTQLTGDAGLEDIIGLRKEAMDQDVENTKKAESEKTEAIKSEQDLRYQAIRGQIEELKLLRDGASQEEIAFTRRQNNLAIEEEKAKGLKVKEERDLELERIRLQKQQLQTERDQFNAIEATKQRQQNELLAAIRAEATQEELQILRDKQAIEIAELEAKNIRDEEERLIELERIAEHREALREREIEENENDMLLKEEFKQLEDEDRALAEQQDLSQLTDQQVKRRQIILETSKQRAADRKKAQDERIANEIKYGKASAAIQAAINSNEVQGASKAAGELVQLTQSKNNTLKTVGKIAAITDISTKTAQSAVNIFNGFSTIPFIGVALGIAGAAAAVAFGAEKINQVRGAVDGGMVTGGQFGVDSNPFMLARGELIAPDRNFDEVVEGTARQRGFIRPSEESTPANQTEGGNTLVMNFPEGSVVENEAFFDDVATKMDERVRYDNFEIGDTEETA